MVANGTVYPNFVAYHFLDASGELMAMEEDGKKTEKILREGLSIDGSSIKGMSTVEKSDLRVVPEEDTFLKIKVGDDFVHHRFLSHLVDENGNPHPRDPRSILRKQVDMAHAMGFEPYMFSEVEFYLVDENTGLPADTAGYCSLPPKDKAYAFRQELALLCEELGMSVKRIHHECGPGQNEIELNLTPCMKNADDTTLCMWLMRMLAAKQGKKIMLSPKPFKEEAGNGLHHHILLRDITTGDNVLVGRDVASGGDNSQCHQLSTICEHAIAGLLKYADDITAVFASSEETFTRLRPGFEAPIYKTWGFSNRTALVRVPKSSSDSTRFEYRGGDLSGSVHLFGAVLLAAVLKGIEEKLKLPPCADYNVEHLSEVQLRARGIEPVPRSFRECIDVLAHSEFLKEALGMEMAEYLMERDKTLVGEGAT